MDNINPNIPAVLLKLHIGPHRKGFNYIKETIALMMDGKCECIMEAYKHISAECGASVNSIEVACRRAVREGMMECSKEMKLKVFGYDIDVEPRAGRDYYKLKEFVPYVINYLKSGGK